MMSDSYATTGYTNNMPGLQNTMNQSMIHSELGMSPVDFREQTSEPIDEYPVNKFRMRGYSQQNPNSPSRFKLGMYRKNMVLAEPRRNNLTLKWENAGRRAISSEKKA